MIDLVKSMLHKNAESPTETPFALVYFLAPRERPSYNQKRKRKKYLSLKKTRGKSKNYDYIPIVATSTTSSPNTISQPKKKKKSISHRLLSLLPLFLRCPSTSGAGATYRRRDFRQGRLDRVFGRIVRI